MFLYLCLADVSGVMCLKNISDRIPNPAIASTTSKIKGKNTISSLFILKMKNHKIHEN